MERRYYVTGGLGFIGSRLVRRLLKDENCFVTVCDKRLAELPCRLADLNKHPRLSIQRIDMMDLNLLKENIRGHSLVFHLAANASSRSGHFNPNIDFNDGIQITFNLLEAMRANDIKDLVYSSSSAVYGNLALNAVDEAAGPLLPVSTYGAEKLSCEGWIASYCALFGFRSEIIRFGNPVGSGMERGIIYDFIEKIMNNSSQIRILGDGTQARTYISVDDSVDAILHLAFDKRKSENCRVTNVSGEGLVCSFDLLNIIASEFGLLELSPVVDEHSKVGWPGDLPIIALKLQKMNSLGLVPKPSIDAVKKAARDLIRERRTGRFILGDA